MTIEKFLKSAFPSIDADTMSIAVDEFKTVIRTEVARAHEESAELRDENERLRREVSRLNTVIANQRAGWENASPAALAILAERARQKRMEGYTDTHDDEHVNGELGKAAACYLIDAIDRLTGGEGYPQPPEQWPWEPSDWKRKDIHRQLEISGALSMAELERLERNGLDAI